MPIRLTRWSLALISLFGCATEPRARPAVVSVASSEHSVESEEPREPPPPFHTQRPGSPPSHTIPVKASQWVQGQINELIQHSLELQSQLQGIERDVPTDCVPGMRRCARAWERVVHELRAVQDATASPSFSCDARTPDDASYFLEHARAHQAYILQWVAMIELGVEKRIANWPGTDVSDAEEQWRLLVGERLDPKRVALPVCGH